MTTPDHFERFRTRWKAAHFAFLARIAVGEGQAKAWTAEGLGEAGTAR